MKIAISGKGGVGKSTIAGALALLLSQQGKRVLALDADPDANLAGALGFPDHIVSSIVPIADQLKLIEERTGAKVKQYGQVFKLNPEVADVAEKMAVSHNNVSLLVLGAVEQGGSGCACPENVFIRSLVTDLVMYKDDLLIMDMEAGVEHLGRATAKGVDAMLIVVEPGRRSIDCAKRVWQMSNQIGISNIHLVFNKIADQNDHKFIESHFPNVQPLASIPLSEEIRKCDQSGLAVTEGIQSEVLGHFKNLANHLSKAYSK